MSSAKTPLNGIFTRYGIDAAALIADREKTDSALITLPPGKGLSLRRKAQKKKDGYGAATLHGNVICHATNWKKLTITSWEQRLKFCAATYDIFSTPGEYGHKKVF